MARRFWIAMNSIALVLFVGNFAAVAVACLVRYVKHVGVPWVYLAVLPVSGYLSWSTFRALRRRLRPKNSDTEKITTA